jgi:hypothetical protein
MLIVVALLELHVNVEDCPELIVVGEAPSVTVGNGTTVTVTSAVVLPLAFVAVSVYVVVVVGVTFRVPDAATEPIP